MLSITYRKHGLKVNAVWFCDDEALDQVINASRADIVFLHGVQSNSYRNSVSGLQYTLMTDLTGEPDDIFQRFGHSLRKNLRKAQRENIECSVYEAEDLKENPDILTSFEKEYAEFTRLKGIKNTYNRVAMEQFIDQGSVMVSKAAQGGLDYAQHVCIFDGMTVRGLYSVSNFRTEGYDPGVAGMANKYLEWNDIQYFNRKKCRLYDWGGLNKTSERNGVDQFKLGFGGTEYSYYNVFIGKSLIGKLFIHLLKFIKYTSKM